MLGVADEHPQTKRARGDQECGANSGKGGQIDRDRSFQEVLTD
jgi:hypothetical protein